MNITPSDFAAAFERFQQAILANPKSDGPFVDFQTGLAALWEHYKAWLYREAQRLLAVGIWKESWIGTGRILDHVILAIEIKHDKDHRNNIVEWETKGRGEGVFSHAKLLACRDDKTKLREAESTLYDLYFRGQDGEATFESLGDLFGRRYDLISYLYFLRDWNRFMPVRSTIFPQAFGILGIPYAMVKTCNWENYQGFLLRLEEVRRHLTKYEIPGGVRLVDAHSFCWMLAKLPVANGPANKVAKILTFTPEAGSPPSSGNSGSSGFSQEDLDALLSLQRRIGGEAQRVVIRAERARLVKAGRFDLASRVDDVSNDTSLGFDIESFEEDGTRKPIEVKALAYRGEDIRFFLSENERRASQKLNGYTFALVADLGTKKPTIHEFPGKELPKAAMHAVNYEVRLKTPPHR